MSEDLLKIADRTFCSRLFVGTGKFSSQQILEKTLIASQTQMVTMALRRVDLNNPDDHILKSITNFQLLPNTSGARNAQEAVRLARMARASGLTNWIKLEVTPEPRYLLPDGEQTVLAAQQLVAEGFVVLPYIQADPIIAKRLAEIGTAAVMPLAAPIGSNKGIKNAEMLAIILEQADVPVIVDAGLGKPSDAAFAMEMGAAAVLVNTAIATADNPVLMAQAFAQAVQAGRKAYLATAGNYNSIAVASASSPLAWISDLDV